MLLLLLFRLAEFIRIEPKDWKGWNKGLGNLGFWWRPYNHIRLYATVYDHIAASLWLFIIIFLSALLQNCWNGDLTSTLDAAQLCSSRCLGQVSGLVWGALYSHMFAKELYSRNHIFTISFRIPRMSEAAHVEGLSPLWAKHTVGILLFTNIISQYSS